MRRLPEYRKHLYGSLGIRRNQRFGQCIVSSKMYCFKTPFFNNTFCSKQYTAVAVASKLSTTPRLRKTDQNSKTSSTSNRKGHRPVEETGAKDEEMKYTNRINRTLNHKVKFLYFKDFNSFKPSQP